MKNKPNTAFENSLAFLSRPAAMAALVVLLLNDHLFRRLWPSWLFGKLGDLAWLFVFPAFLTIPLSILIPTRTQSQARRVGLAAYIATAVVFACANLFSVVHGAIVKLLETMLRTPIGLVRDPADLMALMALIFSWKLWRKSELNESLAWRGLTAVSIVLLLTVANGPGPDVGIVCLEVQDDLVMAQSAYYSYSSSDGGITWRLEEERHIFDCDYYVSTACNIDRESYVDTVAQGSEVIFRFQPCGSIQASRDGGDSWHVVNPLTPFSEAERIYYEAARAGEPSSRQGPFDAVFDENTGNVIFAMGHQGVLLMDETGAWRTIPVGAYIPYDLIGFSNKLLFVSGEGFLSVIAGLLLLNSMLLDIQRSRRNLILLMIAIAIFLMNAIVFRPSVVFSFGSVIFFVFYVVFGLVLLLAAIERMITLQRSHRLPLKFMLMLTFLSITIYSLPFVLWILNAIPNYDLALGFSLFSTTLLYYAWRRRIKMDSASVVERETDDGRNHNG